MTISRDKVDEVGYSVAGDEQHPDESKVILKYSFSNSEDSVPSDEDDKEGIEVLEEESNSIIVIL